MDNQLYGLGTNPAERENCEKTVPTRNCEQTLVLSDDDRDLFLDALVNPPNPNANLVRAFLTHQ